MIKLFSCSTGKWPIKGTFGIKEKLYKTCCVFELISMKILHRSYETHVYFAKSYCSKILKLNRKLSFLYLLKPV